MAKKKKKNIQSTNAQNEKVTLEKRQAKKDVVLGTKGDPRKTAGKKRCGAGD
jgi:hypothetical protein